MQSADGLASDRTPRLDQSAHARYATSCESNAGFVCYQTRVLCVIVRALHADSFV